MSLASRSEAPTSGIAVERGDDQISVRRKPCCKEPRLRGTSAQTVREDHDRVASGPVRRVPDDDLPPAERDGVFLRAKRKKGQR